MGLITYFSFLHMPDSMLSISAADGPTPSSPQPSTSGVHQKKKKKSKATPSSPQPSISGVHQKKKKKKKSKASRALEKFLVTLQIRDACDLDTQEIRMNGKENVISLSFLIKSIKFLNGAITMPS